MTTPCATDPRLFDSTSTYDHHVAAAMCAECPALAWCREQLQKARKASRKVCAGGPQGTWAGQLVGSPRTAKCGTVGGHKRHMRRGERPCSRCRAAHARRQRERVERKRAAAGYGDIYAAPNAPHAGDVTRRSA